MGDGQPAQRRHRLTALSQRTGGFWSDNAIYGAATAVAGICNYFFSLILAKGLGPTAFGDIITLINVTGIFFIPAPMVGLLAIRLGKSQRWTRWVFWGLGLGLWGGIWESRGILRQTFHMPSSGFVLYGAAVIPAMMVAANTGYLQRARLYVWVGVLDTVYAALGIIIAGIGVLTADPIGWIGILSDLAMGAIWVFSEALQRKTRHVANYLPERHVLWATGVMGLVAAVLASADSLIAKFRLPALAAGLYNGLATVGHAIPFLASSIATVMLTAIIDRPQQRVQYLGRTLAVWAAMSAIAQGLFVWAAKPLVILALGTNFTPVADWLAAYGWAMVSMAMLNIVLAYVIASRQWSLGIPAILGVGAWVLGLLHARTVGELVIISARVLGITAIISLAVLGWYARQYTQHESS